MEKREIIDGLKAALRTMGAAGITGSEAMDAFATMHQLVGRLEADLMEGQRRAAQAGARAARLPRPAVETIDPGDITPEMETEAARGAAFERVMMSPDDNRDGLDDLCDILDEDLKPYLLPSRIASSF